MSLSRRARVLSLRGLAILAVGLGTVLPGAASSIGLPPPIDPGLRALAAASHSPQSVQAAVRTVNSVADTTDGVCDEASCTLREALLVAQAGDAVVFSSIFDTPQTIRLTQALPAINADLTITGPGALLLTVRRDSGGDYRILTINGGTVSIAGMTLQNGSADYGGAILSYATNLTVTDTNVFDNSAAASGGGVAAAAGTLLLERTTFSGNSALEGGAVYVQFPVTTTLRNCTVSGNRAFFSGGVNNRNDDGGAPQLLAILNSTIASNRSSVGGGVWTNSSGSGVATTSLKNSIIADNTPANIDQSGTNATTVSQGNNLASDGTGGVLDAAGDLINTDPQLLHLATNGGKTPTRLPRLGSAAIDAGNNSGAPATDQRGVPRPQGGTSDIGAVEVRPLVVTSTLNAGTGTLHDAIDVANTDGIADDIFFSNLFDAPQTILLGSALPSIATDMTISGPGANLLTVRAGTTGYSMLTIVSGAAAVSGVTLAGGSNTPYGGGINNLSALTVTDSVITDNHATTNGGGLHNGGALYVFGSTISANSALYGGGVFNFATASNVGAATFVNTTIAGNSAPDGGYAFENDSFAAAAGVPTSTLLNCTIADAQGAIVVYDEGPASILSLENTILKAGAYTSLTTIGENSQPVSLGHNLANDAAGGFLAATGDLVSTDPLLAKLANYGGTTPTLFPKPGSAAVEGADDSAAPFADQRGISRPQGAHADIGAVESNGILIFQDGFDGD